jgi:hypothetical protein
VTYFLFESEGGCIEDCRTEYTPKILLKAFLTVVDLNSQANLNNLGLFDRLTSSFVRYCSLAHESF